MARAANDNRVRGCWLVAVVLGLSGVGRADQIILRGGGQIRGVVVPDPARPEHVLVQTEAVAAPIAFRKEQVQQVVAEPGPLREYLARRDATPATAQAQYELGLWCEERKLSGPAEVHYQKALELDEGFGPAHKKLGHVLQGDRWLTFDEVREAQGLVKHKGRWITREEKEQIDARAALSAAQTSWARRLKALREVIDFGTEEARRDAEQQLREIRDPAAVAPLVRAFGRDAGPQRAFLVEVLGGIPGPEAAGALVARLFDEGEPTLRQMALDELIRRQEPDTVSRLTKSLSHTNPRVVGRAAWGLAGLGAVAAVPKLIPALVTVRQRVTWVPVGQAPAGIPAYGFGSIPPVRGGNPYVPVLTGPVVAPGVAAYGATSVPLYSLPGAGLTSVRPRLPYYQPRTVRSLARNAEVLEALVRLTGRDFGYDAASWRRWLASAAHADPAPERIVPQP